MRFLPTSWALTVLSNLCTSVSRRSQIPRLSQPACARAKRSRIPRASSLCCLSRVSACRSYHKDSKAVRRATACCQTTGFERAPARRLLQCMQHMLKTVLLGLDVFKIGCVVSPGSVLCWNQKPQPIRCVMTEQLARQFSRPFFIRSAAI